VLNSDQYLDVSHCNILSVEPQVAVPQPSPDILRLDVLQPCGHAEQRDVNKYTYKITWGDKLPKKCMFIISKTMSFLPLYMCNLRGLTCTSRNQNLAAQVQSSDQVCLAAGKSFSVLFIMLHRLLFFCVLSVIH
jgi:hypothetical protein